VATGAGVAVFGITTTAAASASGDGTNGIGNGGCSGVLASIAAGRGAVNNAHD
jgi:hypothetical protein